MTTLKIGGFWDWTASISWNLVIWIRHQMVYSDRFAKKITSEKSINRENFTSWFIFPVVFTTQLQRWRESSNKCTDSVNVRVHQAKWMVPSAKWSGTAFCHHSPPIRPSLDPFLLHIFSAEYKLPRNILYFKFLAYHCSFYKPSLSPSWLFVNS